MKGIVSERKNFPDRWPFLRERATARGEQAVRCGTETCSHCKKQQEEGKAEHIPGERRAVRVSKAKERDRRKD